MILSKSLWRVPETYAVLVLPLIIPSCSTYRMYDGPVRPRGEVATLIETPYLYRGITKLTSLEQAKTGDSVVHVGKINDRRIAKSVTNVDLLPGNYEVQAYLDVKLVEVEYVPQYTITHTRKAFSQGNVPVYFQARAGRRYRLSAEVAEEAGDLKPLEKIPSSWFWDFAGQRSKGIWHPVIYDDDTGRLVSRFSPFTTSWQSPTPVVTAENRSLGQKETEKGYQLRIERRLNDSLDCFERAILHDPTNAMAWFGKGAVFSDLGNHERSREACEAGLDLNPQMEWGWLCISCPLYAVQSFRESLNCIDRALEIRPAYADGWRMKGNMLLGLGWTKEALKCVNKAVELDRNDKYAWNLQGRILEALGRKEHAQKAFNQEKELEKKTQAKATQAIR